MDSNSMIESCVHEVYKNGKKTVEKLLKSFGEEMYVTDEKYIDIATAISGTGPTYIYLLAESMIDSGIYLGLSREQTKKLVYQTILGSIKYMIKSEEHPAILRNDITSPGGTSASALYILEKTGFRGIFFAELIIFQNDRKIVQIPLYTSDLRLKVEVWDFS